MVKLPLLAGLMTCIREALENALKQLEEWKRGFRERGKRRSSRAEGQHPRGTGRRPGRKAGHAGAHRAVPRRVDRTVEYEAPKHRGCGGAVEPTDEPRSTIVEDLPVVASETVKHVAHVGRCKRWRRRPTGTWRGTSAWKASPRVGDSGSHGP